MTSPRRATRVLPRCSSSRPSTHRRSPGSHGRRGRPHRSSTPAAGAAMSQNGPVSPSSANTAVASSGVRRRWSSCSRSRTRPCRAATVSPGRPRPRPRRGPGRRPAGWSSRSGPRRPPAGRRVKEPGHVQLGRRGLGVGQHGQRPAAAGAGGGHQHFLVERGHDPERVPGAAAPPLLLGRGDHEVHLPGREGMGHADPDPVLVQDQRVDVVEPSPAGQHLLDPDARAPGGLEAVGRRPCSTNSR